MGKSAALALLLVSCSVAHVDGPTGSSTSTGGTTSGSGGTTGSDHAAGPHPAWPQVPSGSGKVLDAPVLQVITFNTLADGTDPYPFQAEMESFGAWLVGSSWLGPVGNEYGVHSASADSPVRLNTTPPGSIADSDVRSMLTDLIHSGTVPPPPANNERLYMFFFPADTAVYLDNGAQACTDFEGYHFDTSITVNGQSIDVPYAVIPDCNLTSTGISESQQLEAAASHELIEAATDPSPSQNPAYILDDDSSPWTLTGGELGDICANDYLRDQATNFVVQRSWSNTLAKGPGSPCAPAPDPAVKPFLGVAATVTSRLTADAGDTVDVPLVAWSNAPHGPWPLKSLLITGTFDPQPITSPDYVGNGDTGKLTLTIPPNAQRGQEALVWVFTPQTADTDSEWWPVVVQVR